MKTLNKLFSIGVMALLLMLMAPHKSMAQDDDYALSDGYVSDQEFYDELQQYGTWVQDDQYGDVWVPDVDGDFRPYATDGYWVQTDYGTTWVSDYPWGWATFHYGRWRYDDYYGWEWIPGHEWAPAWVTWRQGGGYYGWAPMGPGISLTLSLGGVGLSIGNDYWVYAPQRYITSRYISRYYAPRSRVSIIIRKTTYIHNTYVYNKRTYITGPRPADIQKITRKKVTVYKINNAGKPGAFKVGGNNTITIYRPTVKKTPDARPVRVVSATAYKNQHPTEGIGKKGATGYNHGNAAKLASTARSDNPNSTVVKINPRKPGANKPNEPVKINEFNKPNRPAKGNEPNKPNEPVLNNHSAAPGGSKGAEPKGNDNQAPLNNDKNGKGHHKNGAMQTPPAQQAAGQAPQQPAVNTPVGQPANNTPAQTTPASEAKGHKHKSAPAVMPAEQHNSDQSQQQQQVKAAAQQQKLQQQQAAQQQKQQQEAAQQQRQQAQQEQKLQQQQAQEAARQAAQQQRQQQQQAQQAARQQAVQQQRLQQQQAQQAAKQAAQQQKQQQQQAQQAARQAAQQQQRQQQEAAKQAAEQQRQQQEQQKKDNGGGR